MVDLIVQMNGDGSENQVIGAFNIKGWKNGVKKLDQDTISAYSNIPLRTLVRVLQRMVAKGWLKRHLGKGRIYVYEKSLEEMTWDECHELGRKRLIELQQKRASKSNLKCQNGISKKGVSSAKMAAQSAIVANQSAKMAFEKPESSENIDALQALKVFLKDYKRGEHSEKLPPQILEALNQERTQRGLSLISDHPKTQLKIWQALDLYLSQLLESYRRYLDSRDKYWSARNYPFNGFVDPGQAENWKASGQVPMDDSKRKASKKILDDYAEHAAAARAEGPSQLSLVDEVKKRLREEHPHA